MKNKKLWLLVAIILLAIAVVLGAFAIKPPSDAKIEETEIESTEEITENEEEVPENETEEIQILTQEELLRIYGQVHTAPLTKDFTYIKDESGTVFEQCYYLALKNLKSFDSSDKIHRNNMIVCQMSSNKKLYEIIGISDKGHKFSFGMFENDNGVMSMSTVAIKP